MTGPLPPAVAALPVCPRRNLPIPYIAEVTPNGTANFGVLDAGRAAECLQGRLCAMCGRRMGKEVALIGDVVSVDPGGYFIEPPVHERCGETAMGGLCPYLSLQRVPRRPPGPGMALVGPDEAELAQVGRTVAKRPLLMAVAAAYTAAYALSNDGHPVMVYQAADLVRVRLFDYGADGRLAEVTPKLRVRAVRTQRCNHQKRKRNARH